MNEQNNQLKLSFAQLLILLGLQVALLSGAFYVGARFGSQWMSASTTTKITAKDQEVAKLFPSATDSATEVKDPNTEANPNNYNTPFDKSAGAVFRIKSSENSAYTLQMGSYPDESAAAKVVDHWKNKGYMAYLSVEDIPDKGKWYRVNVGNFGSEVSASEYAKNIKEKENVQPQVVLTEQ